MRFAGIQCNGVVRHIGCLDRGHVQPRVRLHVRHRRGKLLPRVPHHGRVRSALRYRDLSPARRIVQHAGRASVHVRAVYSSLKRHRTRGLPLALEAVDLVDELRTAQPIDRDLLRIRHRVVDVERLFEHQRCALCRLVGLCRCRRGPSAACPAVAGIVLHSQFQRQLVPDAHSIPQLEVVEAQAPAQLVRRQRKRQVQGRIASRTRHPRKLQLPLADAREAVLRPGLAVVPVREPRKDDGHAAADGLARHELRALTQEDRRCLARRLPVG